MVSYNTWVRYLAHKLDYSVSLVWKNYANGQISGSEASEVVWKNMFQGKLTYLHWNKGVEMAPTVGTLLVRRIPTPDSDSTVAVGDVVVVKDPSDSENHLVRRLAAVEGYEMVSTDEKDDPFVLEKGECWVLSDNEAVKPKEAKDSRTFGPVHMSDIVGRAIYCLRNAVDHGRVRNSNTSMLKDTPVLDVELDVEEMAKNMKE